MLYSASFVVSFRHTGRVLINSFYMRHRGTYPCNIIPNTFPPYAPMSHSLTSSLSLSLSLSLIHTHTLSIYLSLHGHICVLCVYLSCYRIATTVFPALHCYYQKPLRKANSLYRTRFYSPFYPHVYCVCKNCIRRTNATPSVKNEKL